MTLESRAARAVRSIRASVHSARPAPISAVVRRQRLSLVNGLAAFAVVAVAGVALAAVVSDSGRESVAITDPSVPVTALPVDDADESTPGREYPEPPPDGVFQDNAVNTSQHPWTMFYGSAPAGTVVEATSAYGSASTVVGLKGEFILKLVFDDPPLGVEFPVTVKMNGEVSTFGFTWTWDPSTVEITAKQKHGSSSNPKEVFFGTAPPDTEITASSAYGASSTTSGKKGEWMLDVAFSGAPSGTPFPIEVVVGDQAFAFSFTWNAATTTTKPSTTTTTPSSVSIAEMHKDEGQGQWMKVRVVGPVGTTVRLTSAYGSSSQETIKDGKGAWVKVFFSGIPMGETIPVTLQVNGAAHSTHSFTNAWDPANTPITIDLWHQSKDGSVQVKAHGTAPPGTAVTVETNGYGSSSGSAGGNGKYAVHFTLSPTPDPGVTVVVTVTVGGQQKVFQFTP